LTRQHGVNVAKSGDGYVKASRGHLNIVTV
jgi:hypothetical protein